jgi:hypothetical protein
MGLFRLAAVVGIGVALLPSDRAQQDQLIDRASSAAKWTFTFCMRNETTCTQAAGFWDGFKKKAEFGAKLAYDMVMEKSAAQIETGSIKQPANGTLTQTDLKPEWRGKPR